MAATRPIFVRKDATKGTTPVDARLALAGLVARPGVLSGLVMSGTAGWGYSFSAGVVATSKSDADGVAVWANDAAVTGSTSAAPVSGSRIDVGYVLHHDVDGGDADSEPVIGVTQGTASGTPSAPSIPAGAIEVGRATVPAGASNTNGATFSSANVQYTASRGAPIPVTGAAQRNLITWGTLAVPAVVYRRDTGQIQINRGSGWDTLAHGAWAAYNPETPTISALGGGATRSGRYTVVDKMCTFEFDITLGTSGVTVDLGTLTIGLPLPAAETSHERPLGTVFMRDASALTGEIGYARATSSASLMSIRRPLGGATDLVTNNLPWVWASSDYLRGVVVYEIA